MNKVILCGHASQLLALGIKKGDDTKYRPEVHGPGFTDGMSAKQVSTYRRSKDGGSGDRDPRRGSEVNRPRVHRQMVPKDYD